MMNENLCILTTLLLTCTPLVSSSKSTKRLLTKSSKTAKSPQPHNVPELVVFQATPVHTTQAPTATPTALETFVTETRTSNPTLLRKTASPTALDPFVTEPKTPNPTLLRMTARPINTPTATSTDRPSFAPPVPSPTYAPSSLRTQQSSSQEPSTQKPSTHEPTTKPTEDPTDNDYYDNNDYLDYYDNIEDQYDPTGYYDDAWLDYLEALNSLTETTCRCDDENYQCLLTPLPRGANMTVCLFVPTNYSLVETTSLVLTHGTINWNYSTFNESSVVTWCETRVGNEGYDDVCVLEFAVDESLYDMNETEVTVAGSAVLVPKGRPRLLAEADFSTIVPLDVLAVDGILGDDDKSQNLNAPRTGENDDASTSTSKSRVEWLLPLLTIVVVGAICAMIIYQKHRA